jgi:poly(3-hydroxybutyrate) depolymerase
MRLRKFSVFLPIVISLTGCFESSGPTNSNPSQNSATALTAWASTANLVLPGDTNLAPTSLRARWDSVVNLKAYAVQARTDLQRILADWAGRDPVATGWTVVDVDSSTNTDSLGNLLGKMYLVSFSVDGISQGGLVWVPFSTRPLPVVLFGHPDDNGIDDSYVQLLGDLMGPQYAQAIIVAPAYRGETATLTTDYSNVTSDASTQSPWDRDVDDGLAFLGATLNHFSTDSSRIATVGYSRGGGVSLISAFRDPSIHSVFEIAGPTDFFSRSMQSIAMGLVQGQSYNLPGLDYLQTQYLQPFQTGSISADSLRSVLLRRSPARWALSGVLAPTEAVHGTADSTVNPDQSKNLVAADPGVAYLSIAGMTHTSFLDGSTDADFAQATTISNSLQAFLRTHLSLN